MFVHVPRFRRAFVRPALLLLLLVLALDTWHITSQRPRTIYSELSTSRNSPDETYFIASIHRNTGHILAEAWNDAILKLAQHLGPQRVFVSALESGSQDHTKDELRVLKQKLDAAGVPNNISLGVTVWEQLGELNNRPKQEDQREPGWIWNIEEKRYDLRRIPYLARTRNQAMEPLYALKSEGKSFDKIIWFNDVVFEVGNHNLLYRTMILQEIMFRV
jgi:hypothetical protein